MSYVLIIHATGFLLTKITKIVWFELLKKPMKHEIRTQLFVITQKKLILNTYSIYFMEKKIRILGDVLN